MQSRTRCQQELSIVADPIRGGLGRVRRADEGVGLLITSAKTLLGWARKSAFTSVWIGMKICRHFLYR